MVKRALASSRAGPPGAARAGHRLRAETAGGLRESSDPRQTAYNNNNHKEEEEEEEEEEEVEELLDRGALRLLRSAAKPLFGADPGSTGPGRARPGRARSGRAGARAESRRITSQAS